MLSASSSATHHRFSTSILPLDLIILVKSFILFILPCRFISSSSVKSSCMLFTRCKLHSLNKAKILAQQSPLPLSYPIIGFFAHASISAGSLCLCKPLFCCSRSCGRPEHPPFSLPNSSSIDPSPLGSKISMSSFLLCVPPKSCLTCPSSLQ